MRRTTLGATGIEVTEVALGTWGLSGDGYGPTTTGDQARSVIERARAMGINLFETSLSYGLGKMEAELGTVLSGDGDVVVVTKWGTDRTASVPRKRFEPDYLDLCLEQSRKHLGTDTRMIALLHNPSQRALAEGAATARLSAMQSAGDILCWGVSVGSEEVARAALDAEAPIISLAYNILTVQPLRAISALLEEKRTGVLAHSVLFYGLLAGHWGQGKRFALSDHRSDRWTEGMLATRLRHLDAVRPLVSGEVTSMRSAALRFVLQSPQVHSAILGPRTAGQLDQLVRDLRGELPYLSPAKLSALEGRLQHLEVPR